MEASDAVEGPIARRLFRRGFDHLDKHLPKPNVYKRRHARLRDHMAMESPRILVRVIPRARVDEVAGRRDGVLVVRVTAAPEGGRANAALCRLIAKRAGVGVRSVSVVRGASSRQKIVQVDGISATDLERALDAGEQ